MRGSAEADFYLLQLDMLKIPEGRKAEPHVVAILKESIARVGVINPVTVTHDHTLVAGMNRVVASTELGLESVPVIVLQEGEPIREIELAENLARLHLTPEQLAECRAYEAKLLAEKQEMMSVRAAAEAAGVPETTARRRLGRRELSTAPGGAVESPAPTITAPPAKRPGKDGKKRPVRKPPASAVAARRSRSRALRGEGQTIPEIAETLGVSLGTVAADLKVDPPPSPPPSSRKNRKKVKPPTEDIILPLASSHVVVLDGMRGAVSRAEWLAALAADVLAPTSAERVRRLLARALTMAASTEELATIVQDIEVALERLEPPVMK